MKTIEIPNPDEGWAEVELYRWQHGELPPQNGDCKPISKPEALRAFVRMLNEGDTSKLPPMFSVAITLAHLATQLEFQEHQLAGHKALELAYKDVIDDGLNESTEFPFTNDGLVSGIKRIKSKRDELQNQLTTQSAEISDLKQNLSDANATIEELRRENTLLINDRDQWRDKHAELHGKYTNLLLGRPQRLRGGG